VTARGFFSKRTLLEPRVLKKNSFLSARRPGKSRGAGTGVARARDLVTNSPRPLALQCLCSGGEVATGVVVMAGMGNRRLIPGTSILLADFTGSALLAVLYWQCTPVPPSDIVHLSLPGGCKESGVGMCVGRRGGDAIGEGGGVQSAEGITREGCWKAETYQRTLEAVAVGCPAVLRIIQSASNGHLGEGQAFRDEASELIEGEVPAGGVHEGCMRGAQGGVHKGGYWGGILGGATRGPLDGRGGGGRRGREGAEGQRGGGGAERGQRGGREGVERGRRGAERKRHLQVGQAGEMSHRGGDSAAQMILVEASAAHGESTVWVYGREGVKGSMCECIRESCIRECSSRNEGTGGSSSRKQQEEATGGSNTWHCTV
jgi:hypothetical protein